MKRTVLLPLLLSGLLCHTASLTAQEHLQDRSPAVAGQFYPRQKDELTATLKDLFSKAVPSKNFRDVVAIIAPHAGYVFSGEVAASAYNQIDPAREYENIFILGPSHHVGFDGASVYSKGNFITPLGTVQVNRKLAARLMKEHAEIVDRDDAHMYEHSIEVQLPFLQYRLKKNFRIVPIAIGSNDPGTCKKIAEALRPFFNIRNLFVVSTDFSHYPSYDDALKVDSVTAAAVLSNSPASLLRTLSANEQRHIPNLATSMCGWACVLTMLDMTQGNPDLSMTPIEYRNSGDSPMGDKDRVVGYYAIEVSLKEKKEKPPFNLGDRDKRSLLAIARKTIVEYTAKHRVPMIDTMALSPNARMVCGAFVTLNKHNVLRGCIGRFDASAPLYRVVQEMAIAAATQDHRFPQVEPAEVNELEIEISVLTPMRRISSIDEIKLGRHGIYIRKGSRSGTFLPQVATGTGWSKEEFLGHCAQDKAGIGWDGWKNAEIYVYEAIVFGENDLMGKAES